MKDEDRTTTPTEDDELETYSTVADTLIDTTIGTLDALSNSIGTSELTDYAIILSCGPVNRIYSHATPITGGLRLLLLFTLALLSPDASPETHNATLQALQAIGQSNTPKEASDTAAAIIDTLDANETPDTLN